MKQLKYSTLAFALLGSCYANAESYAITNATIFTANEQGILKDATLLIENGKISAINPAEINVGHVIDAQDKILTPGFIASMNQIGLVEVGAVSASRDGSEGKGGITFDPSLAFNPKSTLIPYARKGGLTRDVIAPSWGESPFVGVSSTVNLSGEFETSVVDARNAVIVNLGSQSKGSRAAALAKFIDKLDAHQKKREKDKKADKKDKDSATPSNEERLLTQVLEGQKPVVIRVSRAQDMLELLKVKKRFNLDMAFSGAEGAVEIKHQLAASNTPVIISAMANLPGDFDSLHTSLNAGAELEKAGVTVAFTVSGDSSHNAYQLRYDAGNAVSYGMSKEAALKAITRNVADIFNIDDAGEIAVGKAADLVLWNADPFEISTKIEKIWINGKEVSTLSRQDKLRERYMADTEMPRAYSK